MLKESDIDALIASTKISVNLINNRLAILEKSLANECYVNHALGNKGDPFWKAAQISLNEILTLRQNADKLVHELVLLKKDIKKVPQTYDELEAQYNKEIRSLVKDVDVRAGVVLSTVRNSFENRQKSDATQLLEYKQTILTSTNVVALPTLISTKEIFPVDNQKMEKLISFTKVMDQYVLSIYKSDIPEVMKAKIKQSRTEFLIARNKLQKLLGDLDQLPFYNLANRSSVRNEMHREAIALYDKIIQVYSDLKRYGLDDLNQLFSDSKQSNEYTILTDRYYAVPTNLEARVYPTKTPVIKQETIQSVSKEIKEKNETLKTLQSLISPGTGVRDRIKNREFNKQIEDVKKEIVALEDKLTQLKEEKKSETNPREIKIETISNTPKTDLKDDKKESKEDVLDSVIIKEATVSDSKVTSPKAITKSDDEQAFVTGLIEYSKSSNDTLKENNDKWKIAFASFSKNLETTANLDHFLKNTRKQIIDTESFTLDNKESGLGAVRIFPPKTANILLDKYDLFGNGLDTARAGLEILKRSNKSTESLKKALKAFHQVIESLPDTQEGRALAYKELKKFNAAISSILVYEANVCPDISTAQESLNFVRDFNWKSTWQNESFCTVMPNPDNDPGMLLRITKPVEVRRSANQNPWNSPEEKPWYKQMKSECGGGPWFDEFVKAHRSELSTIATTPMSRSIPGPSNAYDATLIAVSGTGKIQQTMQGTQVAITEPFDIKDADEKKELTKDAHRSIVFGNKDNSFNQLIYINEKDPPKEIANDTIIIQRKNDKLIAHWKDETNNLVSKTLSDSDLKNIRLSESRPTIDPTIVNLIATKVGAVQGNTRLEKIVQHQYDRWGSLEDKELVVPILHQTLIANSIGSADVGKTRTALENREAANEELQNKLNQHDYYYDINQKKLIEVAHGETLGEGFKKIKFEVLETNNCVNMHHRAYSFRPNDIPHSRKLVELASNRLQTVKESYPEIKQALQTVISFLNSNNKAAYSDEVKQALKDITEYFDKKPTQPISRGKDIALLAQSAAELNCSVYSMEHPDLRIHLDRRNTVHKAVNEQIVAELLGQRFGGCMSSEDRGEEIELQKQAYLRAFHDPGRMRIQGFNDSPTEQADFLRKYGRSTQEKHNFNKLSTGTSISKDAETRAFFGTEGIVSSQEASDEKQLSKEFDKTRKGTYAKGEKPVHEKYVKEKDVRKRAKKGFALPKGEPLSGYRGVVSAQYKDKLGSGSVTPEVSSKPSVVASSSDMKRQSVVSESKFSKEELDEWKSYKSEFRTHYKKYNKNIKLAENQGETAKMADSAKNDIFEDIATLDKLIDSNQVNLPDLIKQKDLINLIEFQLLNEKPKKHAYYSNPQFIGRLLFGIGSENYNKNQKIYQKQGEKFIARFVETLNNDEVVVPSILINSIYTYLYQNKNQYPLEFQMISHALMNKWSKLSGFNQDNDKNQWGWNAKIANAEPDNLEKVFKSFGDDYNSGTPYFIKVNYVTNIFSNKLPDWFTEEDFIKGIIALPKVLAKLMKDSDNIDKLGDLNTLPNRIYDQVREWCFLNNPNVNPFLIERITNRVISEWNEAIQIEMRSEKRPELLQKLESSQLQRLNIDPSVYEMETYSLKDEKPLTAEEIYSQMRTWELKNNPNTTINIKNMTDKVNAIIDKWNEIHPNSKIEVITEDKASVIEGKLYVKGYIEKNTKNGKIVDPPKVFGSLPRLLYEKLREWNFADSAAEMPNPDSNAITENVNEIIRAFGNKEIQELSPEKGKAIEDEFLQKSEVASIHAHWKALLEKWDKIISTNQNETALNTIAKLDADFKTQLPKYKFDENIEYKNNVKLAINIYIESPQLMDLNDFIKLLIVHPDAILNQLSGIDEKNKDNYPIPTPRQIYEQMREWVLLNKNNKIDFEELKTKLNDIVKQWNDRGILNKTISEFSTQDIWAIEIEKLIKNRDLEQDPVAIYVQVKEWMKDSNEEVSPSIIADNVNLIIGKLNQDRPETSHIKPLTGDPNNVEIILADKAKQELDIANWNSAVISWNDAFKNENKLGLKEILANFNNTYQTDNNYKKNVDDLTFPGNEITKNFVKLMMIHPEHAFQLITKYNQENAQPLSFSEVPKLIYNQIKDWLEINKKEANPFKITEMTNIIIDQWNIQHQDMQIPPLGNAGIIQDAQLFLNNRKVKIFDPETQALQLKDEFSRWKEALPNDMKTFSPEVENNLIDQISGMDKVKKSVESKQEEKSSEPNKLEEVQPEPIKVEEKSSKGLLSSWTNKLLNSLSGSKSANKPKEEQPVPSKNTEIKTHAEMKLDDVKPEVKESPITPSILSSNLAATGAEEKKQSTLVISQNLKIREQLFTFNHITQTNAEMAIKNNEKISKLVKEKILEEDAKNLGYIYRTQSNEGPIYADNKASDNKSVYVIYAIKPPELKPSEPKTPEWQRKMLEYAYNQVATFVLNRGAGATITILPTDNKDLADAYYNICIANGLKIKDQSGVIHHAIDVPNIFVNLKPKIVLSTEKSVDSEYSRIHTKIETDLKEATKTINPNVETISKLEADKLLLKGYADKADAKELIAKIDVILKSTKSEKDKPSLEPASPETTIRGPGHHG